MEAEKPRRQRKTLPGPFEAIKPPASGKKREKPSQKKTASSSEDPGTQNAVSITGELEAKTYEEPTRQQEASVILEDEEDQELDASDLIVEEEPKAKKTKTSPPPAPVMEGKRTTSRGKPLPQGVTRIKPFEDHWEQAKASEVAAEALRGKEKNEVQDLGDAYAKAKADYQTLKEEVKGRLQEAKEKLSDRGLSEETIAFSFDMARRELNKKLDAANKKMREAGEAYAARYADWERTEGSKHKGRAAKARSATKQQEEIQPAAAAVAPNARPVAEDKNGNKQDAADQETREFDDALQKLTEARIASEEKAQREKGAEKIRQETEGENTWFAQGEDPSYVQSLAEKQQAEDAKKTADVRRHIAESYDAERSETILDTDQEVDAVAMQAEAMIASGELSPQAFNANDYRYLLLEKARLDRELETAGWWQARKLRAELKDTQKNLADYEQQVHSVIRERATAEPAQAGTPKEATWQPPRIAKEGSGTSIYANKKPGFFARLFRRK